jgi:Prokaryotic dksA/traR C4-type zinc finger
MHTFLDTDIEHAFWGGPNIARTRALFEAANTGGALLQVHSIEIQELSLVFVGTIPRAAIERQRQTRRGRPSIRAQGLGTFHTTWAALIRPSDIIGFFVVWRPVTFTGQVLSTDQGTIRVMMEVRRSFSSIASAFIGPICCIECNEAIAEGRLKAIPGVRTCVICQRRKEEVELCMTPQNHF